MRFTRGKILALSLVAFLMLCYVIYFFFNPTDWIEVAIEGLPADTRFMCLVADGPQGVEAMNWYHSKLGAFAMHPNQDVTTELFRDRSGVTLPNRKSVAWRAAGRVGVLRGTAGGRWQVAWYNPPKSNLQDRSALLGGGHWAARWHDADEIQEPPRSLLSSMGFDYTLSQLPEPGGPIEPVRP
jgi:hypothetical protein